MFFMHPAYGYAGGWRNIAYGGTYQGPVAALANGLHSINWYGATGSYGYSGYSYTPTYCHYYQPRFMSSMFSYGSGGGAGYGYSTWSGPAGFYCYMGVPPYYSYNPYGYSTYDNGNNGRRYGYDTSGRPFEYDPDYYNKRPKRKKVEREDEEAPVSQNTSKATETKSPAAAAAVTPAEPVKEDKKPKKIKKAVKRGAAKEKKIKKQVSGVAMAKQQFKLDKFRKDEQAAVEVKQNKDEITVTAKGSMTKENHAAWVKRLQKLKKDCKNIITKITFISADKAGKSKTVNI